MKYLLLIFSLVLLTSQLMVQTTPIWSNPLSDSGLEYLDIPTCHTSNISNTNDN